MRKWGWWMRSYFYPQFIGKRSFPNFREMRRNALLFQMPARARRTVLDLQARRALREDPVLKVPEVKEVSVGQLGPPALVEIQVLQAPRVHQAPRDPTDCLFRENKVAKG